MINILNESILKQINIAFADFSAGFDETEATRISQIPSGIVSFTNERLSFTIG